MNVKLIVSYSIIVKSIFKVISLGFMLGFFSSCESKIHNQANGLESRVDSVLELMTIKEKIGQMNQYTGLWEVTGPKGTIKALSPQLKAGMVGSMLNVMGTEEVRKVQQIVVDESRLGIPLIIGYDVIHGYKTLAPIPLGESASWDLEAIENSARISALEASASGVNWTFAPMVDISRDARWGRVMEGAGEDTYLGSKIAYARVKGFQGENLSSSNTIAACAKHFAAYGFAEAGKDYNSVDVSESTLRNIILPPFKATVDAGVSTFMNSFNEINGIPATGNKYIQRDILKYEWGFNGFVVSDWGSIKEMVPHGFAVDNKHAAEIALNAGSDMDMESHAYIDNVEELLKEGKIDEKLIDDAVRRILKVKFELGLFDDPYKYCNEENEKSIVGSKEINDAVLDMAKKSIVLLKNDNHILPIKKEGVKIALIGPLAADKDSPLGSWRAVAPSNSAVSVLEGLNYFPNKISYSKGVELVNGKASFTANVEINTTDRTGFKEAISVAKQNDVVIIVLGENAFQSGEGRSRTQINLPGLQQELLEEVYKVNKNIVLVLMNGRPLSISWADEHIPAIVETWHLGTQSGNAIAQVLYGDYNPSGKLTMTFPRSIGQIPIYYNHKNTGRPILYDDKFVFCAHYIDEKVTPLYEFGYGLSYTTFKYSDIKLSKSEFSKKEEIEASIEITNTGDRQGEEVVQMYIRDAIASSTRPVKELKGFEKISLESGETKTVTFKINSETLKFYTVNNKWEVEPGDFDIWIGGSSESGTKSTFKVIK